MDGGASAFIQYHIQHGNNSINNSADSYSGSYTGVSNNACQPDWSGRLGLNYQELFGG